MTDRRSTQPRSLRLDRLQLTWPYVWTIVVTVVAVVMALRATENASGKEVTDLKMRVSVVETKSDAQGRQLDRIENIVNEIRKHLEKP